MATIRPSWKTDSEREVFSNIKRLGKQAEKMFPRAKFWPYIYVIRCHKYYKIGIASNIESRINSLQCGNPYRLEIVYAIKAPNARYTEEKLHEYFKENRYFREWFELPDDVDWDKLLYGLLWREK